MGNTCYNGDAVEEQIELKTYYEELFVPTTMFFSNQNEAEIHKKNGNSFSPLEYKTLINRVNTLELALEDFQSEKSFLEEQKLKDREESDRMIRELSKALDNAMQLIKNIQHQQDLANDEFIRL